MYSLGKVLICADKGVPVTKLTDAGHVTQFVKYDPKTLLYA